MSSSLPGAALRGALHRTAPAPRAEVRPEEDGLRAPQRQFAVAAIFAAITLVVLDGAVANVALPSIALALDVSSAASVWVVTSYQLAVVIALLPCAALGESYGCRRVFMAGVALFTIASALCALSPTLFILAAVRFVQGLGGGAIMALASMMLRFSCPHRLLGRMLGWFATVVALSAAAGPGVGAAILSIAHWPWLFAVNLPIGAAVILAAGALPHPAGTGRPLDLISAAINTAMFGMVVFGTDILPTRPGTAALLIAGAGLCLVVLVRREAQREAPLIPIDLLRSSSLRLAVIASVACFSGQMLSYVALPFYLQHELGQSIVATGLYMMPWPLAVAVTAPISARLTDRLPTSALCAGGATCLALGLLLAGCWPIHKSILPLVLSTTLAGVGFGFFQPANNRTLLLSAPKARSGAAGGMQGTARLVGQTVGAVAMTLLFELAPGNAAPHIGLVVAALCALASGAVSSLRLHRDGKAAR